MKQYNVFRGIVNQVESPQDFFGKTGIQTSRRFSLILEDTNNELCCVCYGKLANDRMWDLATYSYVEIKVDFKTRTNADGRIFPENKAWAVHFEATEEELLARREDVLGSTLGTIKEEEALEASLMNNNDLNLMYKEDENTIC